MAIRTKRKQRHNHDQLNADKFILSHRLANSFDESAVYKSKELKSYLASLAGALGHRRGGNFEFCLAMRALLQ
eukprot:IDg18223t1